MSKVYLISPEAPSPQGAAAGEQRKAGAALRLGTLDNSKSNADHLLAMVIEQVSREFPVASVTRLRKANPSTPAPARMLDQLEAECDLVVSAMAD